MADYREAISGYIKTLHGGQLKQLCDVCLLAPVNSMQITEDIHMVFDHLMMAVLYEALAGRKHLNG